MPLWVQTPDIHMAKVLPQDILLFATLKNNVSTKLQDFNNS
jgi:hypothetical protein